MMGLINGIERTPSQLEKLVTDAGLRVEKVWQCRGVVGIVECRGVFNGEGERGGEMNGGKMSIGANGMNRWADQVA